MNFDLKGLIEALKGADLKTKVVLAVAMFAVVAAIVAGGQFAGRPNFVLLYSGLDDPMRAEVEKALAGGSIRYRASQPPAPYVIYVDEDQYYPAQNLVALSGALKEIPRGIDTAANGASSLFLSTAERLQSMLKRDWQEMERQLETLDFVSQATVTTSIPDSSPIRAKAPMTVSVTLALKSLSDLSRGQAENVAKLVRFRFGVPAENVIVSDQNGRTLYDAGDGGLASSAIDLLDQAQGYDRALEDKINRTLAAAYGPRKALATITTEWDHDQHTSLQETLQPKGTLVREESTKSETPQGTSSSGAGGPAGTASNLSAAQFGADNAAPGTGDETAESSAVPVASTSESSKEYETARSKTHTVHLAPVLKRLSISLVLDESLATKKAEISSLVQAAAGFDGERADVIQVSTTTFASEEVSDPGATIEGGSGGLPPMVETLLQRGVEIAAAVIFLVVLIKTLRGGRPAGSSPRASNGSASGAEGRTYAGMDGSASSDFEPDPEALARARIEELVRTDPRRVGEILSRWAGDGSAVGARK